MSFNGMDLISGSTGVVANSSEGAAASASAQQWVVPAEGGQQWVVPQQQLAQQFPFQQQQFVQASAADLWKPVSQVQPLTTTAVAQYPVSVPPSPSHSSATKTSAQDIVPSKVLLLRKLPEGTTKEDIEETLSSFIFVENGAHVRVKPVCTLLLKESIALVELETIMMATAIMQSEVRIHNRLVGAHYSLKKQLTRRTTTQSAALIPAQPRVLMMLLKECTANVPLDEVFWLCSQYGKVEKVSSVNQRQQDPANPIQVDRTVNVTLASAQVLVQFADWEESKVAIDHFNGQRVNFATMEGGHGSCMVHVSHARVAELTFRVPNDSRKDYSCVNETLLANWPIKACLEHMRRDMGWRIRDALWGTVWCDGGSFEPAITEVKPSILNEEGVVIKISGLPLIADAVTGERVVNPRVLFKICSTYGEIVAVKLCYRSPGCCLVQFRGSAEDALQHLGTMHIFGKKCSAVESHYKNATNWNESEMQKLMYTIQDESAPPRVPSNSMHPPSNRVAFLSLNDVSPEEVVRLALGALKQVGQWANTPDTELVTAVQVQANVKVVEFADVDKAFMALGMLHNTMVRVNDVTLPSLCCFCSGTQVQTMSQAQVQQQPQVMQPLLPTQQVAQQPAQQQQVVSAASLMQYAMPSQPFQPLSQVQLSLPQLQQAQAQQQQQQASAQDVHQVAQVAAQQPGQALFSYPFAASAAAAPAQASAGAEATLAPLLMHSAGAAGAGAAGSQPSTPAAATTAAAASPAGMFQSEKNKQYSKNK